MRPAEIRKRLDHGIALAIEVAREGLTRTPEVVILDKSVSVSADELSRCSLAIQLTLSLEETSSTEVASEDA